MMLSSGVGPQRGLSAAASDGGISLGAASGGGTGAAAGAPDLWATAFAALQAAPPPAPAPEPAPEAPPEAPPPRGEQPEVRWIQVGMDRVGTADRPRPPARPRGAVAPELVLVTAALPATRRGTVTAAEEEGPVPFSRAGVRAWPIGLRHRI
jgi:hypothetical protein